MRRTSGPSSSPRRAGSWRFPKSVACITATSARRRSPAPAVLTTIEHPSQVQLSRPAHLLPRPPSQLRCDRARPTASRCRSPYLQPGPASWLRISDAPERVGQSDDVLAKDRIARAPPDDEQVLAPVDGLGDLSDQICMEAVRSEPQASDERLRGAADDQGDAG